MTIDTTKNLSAKTPFYFIDRNSNGVVYLCVKNPNLTCRCCIFCKCCQVKDEDDAN